MAKRSHLEEGIARLRYQQDWLGRYVCLAGRLKEAREQLSRLLREHSQLRAAEQDLRRFEAFEEVFADCQKLWELRRIQEAGRAGHSRDARRIEEMAARCREQLGLEERLADEYDKGCVLLGQMQEKLSLASLLDGQEEAIGAEAAHTREMLGEHTARLSDMEKQARILARENEVLRAELEQMGMAQQSVEMHRPMMEQAEGVLLRLDRLSELRASVGNFSRMQKERTTRQRELGEQLGRAFRQFQEAETRMQMLAEELELFRDGTDQESHSRLQNNALCLEGLRHQLLAALQLWQRIAAGYAHIEDTRALIHALRQKAAQREAGMSTLQAEADVLRRLCQEKERHYLLGKGQQVIQLRANLAEGTQCPVCGAAHHPFHSSGATEQAALINSFKADSEMARAELRNKENLLQALAAEAQQLRGQLQAAEHHLGPAIRRQKEAIAAWGQYQSLDPSFATCSAEVNREGRTGLLRQLLANAERDAREAREELEAFGRRQSRIARIGREITTLEQRKSELSVWLNETNTMCQVIAGQADYLKGSLDRANRRFGRVYEQLNDIITLPGWLAEWETDAERLKHRIRGMADQWRATSSRIAQAAQALANGEQQLSALRDRIHLQAQMVAQLASRSEELAERVNLCRHRRASLQGGGRPAELYAQASAKLLADKERLKALHDSNQRLCQELWTARGEQSRQAEQDSQINEMLSTLSRQLDLWIRNYNASHPPVQYAELERLFAQSGRWNELRERLATLLAHIAVAQDRVAQMQAELTAMQADASRAPLPLSGADPLGQEDEVRQKLVAAIAADEQSLRELDMQIARLDLVLQAPPTPSSQSE